jgi:hypothetical protein
MGKSHHHQFISSSFINFLFSPQSLPDPIEKQFTLRLSGNTVSQGMGGPQFLRAILSPNEFRLCGAFSQNTTFAYTS